MSLETVAVITPTTTDLAEKVGRRRFRKKILPLGKITYKGQTVDFNREYLSDLVQSFSDEAYDQVPFILADENNAHNELPERFRGELDSLELADDGLYGIISTNRAGAKVLDDNPKLGVSARIIEGLGKADGRVFKRALRHVLGTMDPRVTGLGPWQPVDLSDEATDEVETVDLSAASFEGDKEMAKAKNSTKKRSLDGREIDLSALSDEQFQQLLDMSTAVKEKDDEDVELDEDGNPIVDAEVVEGDEDEDEESEDEDADDEDDEEEPPASKKKKVTKEKETTETDLSNSVIDSETRDQVTQMRIDLAQERFDAYKKDLIEAGVPPFMVDLAEPVLSAPEGAIIDLSNSDDPINATQVIRDLLDGVKGTIDLTPDIGHSIDLAVDQDDEKNLLDQWDQEYGTV